MKGKKKYGGTGVSELGRLKQLEDENQRLKKLVADLSLDKHILQEVLSKSLKPARLRELARWLMTVFQVSQRRACRLVGLGRSTFWYRSQAQDQSGLRMRLKELVVRVRYGYRRLTIRAQFRAVQDHRSHADEAFVAHRAGVDNGAMADGDVIAHQAGQFIGQVEHGVVLDVGMVADDDAVDVAAQDGIIPDAGGRAERHVAQHHRAPGDIDVLAQHRFLAQESVELAAELA